LIKKLVRIIEKPLVLDADGLFPFSNKMGDLNDREYPLIITPHIGELSYLTGIDKEKIISEFPIVMNEVMTDFRHIALVKQVPSCTFYKNSAMVNSSGNPGLATGGTGDVLSGIIASFIAQGIDHYNSVSLAAFIHGKASDALIKEKGYRGQIASDILEKIPYVISGYEKS
jgi:NAD(P)H-hydrate epimerase